jgi:hypothetical protein
MKISDRRNMMKQSLFSDNGVVDTSNIFDKTSIISAASNALTLFRETGVESFIRLDTGESLRQATDINDQGQLRIAYERTIESDVARRLFYENTYKKQQPQFPKAQTKFDTITGVNLTKKNLPYKTGFMRNFAYKAASSLPAMVSHSATITTPEGDIYFLFIDLAVASYAQYPNVKNKIDAVWPDMVKAFEKYMNDQFINRPSGLYGNEGIDRTGADPMGRYDNLFVNKKEGYTFDWDKETKSTVVRNF